MFEGSLKIMAGRLQTLLADCGPSMMLYGSAVLDDFCPGWSELDFLLLTDRPIPMETAEILVSLRQSLLAEHPGNLYFRSFEGAILTKEAFAAGGGPAVYWGTSGQRIRNEYRLDPFSRIELLEKGQVVFGEDFRDLISWPDPKELTTAIRYHYETIRQYGDSGTSWILDIARCLYTLRTGRVIAKTKAGEWALVEGLCPNPQVMERVLKIRKNPRALLTQPVTKAWTDALGPEIQKFADVLECELEKK